MTQAFKRILVCLVCLTYIYGPEIEIAAQTVAATEVRLSAVTAPAPLTGRYRIYVDALDGLMKCKKPDGTNCIAATTSITIGTTTTGAAGTSASVSNSGTVTAPIFNFTIPQGLPGATGPAGPGFTFRGPWQPSTAYNALDIVTNGGNTYEADHSFTSDPATFNAANWNLWAAVGATGPAGGVTSFSTGTFPSWLTPSVTNSTTTPTLSISGGIVPESAGGTGANNTTGAAGHVLRSNGTHYVDSAIQAADVPTLNQNTTGTAGKATANVASWGGGTTGSLNTSSAGSNVNNVQTVTPVALTVVAVSMSVGTAAAGCTTSPIWAAYDVTTSTVLGSVTLTNSSFVVSTTGLSASVASGDTITFRLTTAAAGCGTSPSSATWTIWYKNT